MGLRRIFAFVGFLFSLSLAALSLIGLLGRWNAWADLVNQFAPLWLAVSVAGLLAIALSGAWRRSPITGALIFVAFVAQAVLAGPDLFEGARGGAQDGSQGGASPVFTVLTFNVWNQSQELQAVNDRIIASGADVVALQEALGVEQMSSAALKAAYPYRATCDDWWGCEILILSRRPILDHHYAAPAPTGSGGPLWAVWVTTTDAGGRPVRVLSTHFARPIPPGFRQSQLERLAQITRGLTDRPLVLTCDCNAGGASFTLRRQDDALDGLTRRTHALFSWPAIIDGANVAAPFPFLALDQIYASRDWRTVTVRRLPRSGSDHYPVLIKLARSEGAR